MEKSSISNWIRQSRHRAKKHNIYSDVKIGQIQEIIDYYGSKCAYCDEEMAALDHSFPMKDRAPNVPSNILPLCRSCKDKKKFNDIAWMYNNNYITNEKYTELLKEMLNRHGSEELKKHLKKIMGV